MKIQAKALRLTLMTFWNFLTVKFCLKNYSISSDNVGVKIREFFQILPDVFACIVKTSVASRCRQRAR